MIGVENKDEWNFDRDADDRQSSQQNRLATQGALRIDARLRVRLGFKTHLIGGKKSGKSLDTFIFQAGLRFCRNAVTPSCESACLPTQGNDLLSTD